MKTELNVNNMQCAHCVSTINSELLKLNGVFGVFANIAEKRIEVEHTPDVNLAEIASAITAIGYEVAPTDSFASKAKDWDENPVRVALAEKFFRKVAEHVPLKETDTVLDFGCGTGLVCLQFLPYVNKLVMVDNSPAMLEVLSQKAAQLELAADKFELVKGEIANCKTSDPNLIVSSMAFHHVEDIPTVIAQAYALLTKGGYMAVADLVTEDGSFHEGEQMPHNGFDPKDLMQLFINAGFNFELMEVYNEISKPVNGELKVYPQFIIIVKK